MKWLTGAEVAARLGISRRSLYRWMSEGRLTAADWTYDRLAALHIKPRKRGPARSPASKRYHEGRHNYEHR